jgi:hypothetical protein
MSRRVRRRKLSTILAWAVMASGLSGVIATSAMIATAPPAVAHGDCSLGEPHEDRSSVTGYYSGDFRTVFGRTLFRCEGGEQHAEMHVSVRMFRCNRVSSLECSNPWNLWKGDGKECNNGPNCNLVLSGPCQGTDKLVWVWGRWRVRNADGDVAHQSPNYPDYIPEYVGVSLKWQDCG